MKNRIQLVVLIFFWCLNVNAEVGTSTRCEFGNQLKSRVESLIAKYSKNKRTPDQLKKLYLSQSEEGVTLTLLKPGEFDKHVMMVGLAFNCYTNLKEATLTPTMSLSSHKIFLENWRGCVRNLYAGKIPSPVDQIEKFWAEQIKVCESQKK